MQERTGVSRGTSQCGGILSETEIGAPSAAKAENLLHMSRKTVRLIVAVFAGYCRNRHLHVVGILKYSTCRACCVDEEDL